MNTIKDIRRLNLQLLIDRSGLSDKDFAKTINVSQSFLSQIKSGFTSGGRDIGHNLARKIEVILNFPEGWMDVQQQNDKEYYKTQANSTDNIGITINRISQNKAEYKDVINISFVPHEILKRVKQYDEIIKFVTVNNLEVSMNWIYKKFDILSNIQNIKLISCIDDNMKPTFKRGDILFIDSGIIDFTIDNVYVFIYKELLLIRRIQLINNGCYKILSDNSDVYEAILITQHELDELEFLGIVLGVFNVTMI